MTIAEMANAGIELITIIKTEGRPPTLEEYRLLCEYFTLMNRRHSELMRAAHRAGQCDMESRYLHPSEGS